MNGFIFDIEADSLYMDATKIWYMYFKSLDGKQEMELRPFREGKKACREKIKDWISQWDCPVVAGHNILGYDLWMLWKWLGIEIKVGKKGKDWMGSVPVQFIDTFALSMYLNPDRHGGHGLDNLSSEYGSHKIDFRGALIEAGLMEKTAPKGHEFSFHSDIMEEYGKQDVNGNLAVYRGLMEEAKESYKEWLHPSYRMFQKDYWLYSAQAITGVKFDIEKAKALVNRIDGMMKDIEDNVLPQLPARGLKKGEQASYTMPAKPFKKDGSLSSMMLSFIERHSGKDLGNGKWQFYGKEYDIKAKQVLDVTLPMEIKDSAELKDYFISEGWKPTLWNFERDERGKPRKDQKGQAVKTSPKIQEGGKLCPNLEEIDSEIPKQVVKYLSLRNRRSVVEGWLNNSRLAIDGRLPASISGYAASHRVKHSVVTNVPKAADNVLLGHEMRELFTCDEGMAYVGTDAAALENRTVSHYTWKYDDGAFANLVLEGDSHSFNAFIFFPHLNKKFDKNDPTLKDNPEFKPWRNKAKTGAYLLAYSGGAKKLSESLGLSEKEGKRAFDGYWEANPGLTKFRDTVTKYFETVGRGKHIPAIDGRWLRARSKAILTNLAGQSCGAIVMSYAACLMDQWLGDFYLDDYGRPYYLYKGYVVKRVSMIHDEYSWECSEEIAEEVKELSEKAIVEAGVRLNLKVPLEAEGKIGENWKDVH
jgi:hypothetical protein